MRVTEGRLGDRQRALLAQRRGETLWAELEQPLTGPGGRRFVQIDYRKFERGADDAGPVAVRLVDGDVGQPGEDLRSAVLGRLCLDQIGTIVDEGGAEVAGFEGGVVQYCLQEGDVRGDAANAELRESSFGTGDGCGEIAPVAGHLHEHRVEVRADAGARGDGAAVEADAAAAG